MTASNKRTYFDNEKLKVYQTALKFNEFAFKIISKLRLSDIGNQLKRACNLIVLNIAEGNGKYSNKDRCRYFDISMVSSLESVACLDILFMRKSISENELSEGKNILVGLVSVLVGLIKKVIPIAFMKKIQTMNKYNFQNFLAYIHHTHTLTKIKT